MPKIRQPQGITANASMTYPKQGRGIFIVRADRALWRAELISRLTSKWVLRNVAHKTLGGGAAMHRVARTELRPPFLSFKSEIYSARMNELIKGKAVDCVIAMVRIRTASFLGIVIMSLLIFSAAQQVGAVRPTIWAWGIEGEPELGQGFDVWANVTDDDLDIANVTVEVIGPNMSVNNLLSFNGTFYTGSVPAFPNDGEFSVRIMTYDLANNSRTSGRIYIEYEENYTPPIDPVVTMPIVVLSSVGLMAVVIVLALVYDRRKGPD